MGTRQFAKNNGPLISIARDIEVSFWLVSTTFLFIDASWWKSSVTEKNNGVWKGHNDGNFLATILNSLVYENLSFTCMVLANSFDFNVNGNVHARWINLF
jgi:hypothetical protein